MLILVFFTVFVTVSGLAWAVALKADERFVARITRLRLADYNPPADKHAEELEAPLSARVLQPTGALLVEFAKRFVPAERIEKLRHKLLLTGRDGVEDLDRFLVVRVLMLVAVPVLWIVSWVVLSLHGIDLLAFIVLIAVVGVLGPDAWLNREIAARRVTIRHKLPDILDLLTISVEAGLGFEQALARTVVMVPGPLSDEFARMLGEMRAGASRADALEALDKRIELPELRSFILALIQAEAYGVSIGTILKNQAAEMRVRRQQLAHEMAQKAPVKMLFPMVFCIMPALFIIVAGPAFIAIFHIFHTH
jgi:tight adherence protein C